MRQDEYPGNTSLDLSNDRVACAQRLTDRFQITLLACHPCDRRIPPPPVSPTAVGGELAHEIIRQPIHKRLQFGILGVVIEADHSQKRHGSSPMMTTRPPRRA